jgi:hypothetical protein
MSSGALLIRPNEKGGLKPPWPSPTRHAPKGKPRADRGSRRGAVACLGNKPPTVHCKFALTARHSQLSKGGGQRSKGWMVIERPYILWAGGRPIAPREIPHAGRKSAAPAGEKTRRDIRYGWRLNVPLRQKNSGLNASPLTPAPVRTSRLWLPLAPVSPSLFGIRLPGYCLPLLFHMVVEFCAELPRPILLIMTYETPPFAFRVEAHPQQQGRYLWAIGYGFQTYRRSPLSFATRREAKNDALKAISKIAAHWRRERDPSPVACDGPGGRLKRARPLRPQLSKNSPKVQ